MTAHRFKLNPAQERNLRNWTSSERSTQAFPIVIRLEMPCPAAELDSALARLIDMHPALRSRIARQPDGTLVQEIRSTSETLDRLDRDVISSANGGRWLEDPWRAQRVNPEEAALRCSFFGQASEVTCVRLSVSHMFTDGIGADLLARDFRRLLAPVRDVEHSAPAPDAYSGDAFAAKIPENTEYWKQQLADAPVSCTYSAAHRKEHEVVLSASIRVNEQLAAAVQLATGSLHVTQYALWVTAASALVQALTGQHEQVFRSTYSNRLSPRDANAVAMLAQAVFAPIKGQHEDTLAVRAQYVFKMTMESYARGMYDANALLDWLNSPGKAAAFQPAFEVNYLPAPKADPLGSGDASRRDAGVQRHAEEVRIDPLSGKAEMKVQVMLPGRGQASPLVRLWARRPLCAQRSPEELLMDLLKVMEFTCNAPDTKVNDLPVKRLGSIDSLESGHYSRVAFDPIITRSLLLQIPGSLDCEWHLQDGKLVADIYVSGSTSETATADDALEFLRARQPWMSGSILPDIIHLHQGPRTHDS